jgi:CRISPR-associated protein Cas5t
MIIALQVDVPIACFRQSRAREYAETYPVPPPATIYGMLLSIVGEMDRYKHCGVKLAIAMIPQIDRATGIPNFPEKSTIIRTFRRFKKKEISDPTNARPDYQELLTDIQFAVWVDAGTDPSKPNLPERLHMAFANPSSINRFGGLCLGESRDLVNAVSVISQKNQHQKMSWLIQDEDGLLTLPYWVDHVGSKATRWRRYRQLEVSQNWQIPEQAWTVIEPN